MSTHIEHLSTLQRRMALDIEIAAIQKQVDQRLREIARSAKMPGFRPGKVPLRMIEQSYGAQVQAETLSDAIEKAFGEAVQEHKLRVAGSPEIERRENAGDAHFAFNATFEVYPEVALGDMASLAIKRPGYTVGDADIDRTLGVLQRQRVQWVDATREAQDGDRVTIDFVGKLDDVAFEGGSATDFPFELGEGRMLPDFEVGVRGAAAGQTRSFPVAFPADYGSEKLAGKTAQFEITVKKVEAPVLPAVDADFARLLGIEDGDTEKLRQDIRSNLEREVAQRLRARLKDAVMQALPTVATLELPKALVSAESQALAERARDDLKARGVDVSKMPVPVEVFAEQAEKRVRLGLVISEIVRANGLQAKPDQIRKQIEEFAQSYENPGEVIRHYFSNRERLAEVEALVIENNVVEWVLSKAVVEDVNLAFDELMKNG